MDRRRRCRHDQPVELPGPQRWGGRGPPGHDGVHGRVRRRWDRRRVPAGRTGRDRARAVDAPVLRRTNVHRQADGPGRLRLHPSDQACARPREPDRRLTVTSLLDRFDPAAWVEQASTLPRARWAQTVRPNQLPPAGDWLTWLILAGRGWGKTRTGAEYTAELARTYPGARIALVAATFADGRDTMVEGESGLLAVLDENELRGGSQDLAWNRSMGELFLANGSRFKDYSSEKPRQLRGPQHHFAWADEAAAWLDAHKGTIKDTTWSNLLFGLRLPAQPGWPAGYRTRVIVTTTPRPLALIKVPDSVLEREPHRAGIIQRPSTVTTRGSTRENLANP